MTKDTSEIVEKLKQRLQFTIVVVLFFPTFLETISRMVSNQSFLKSSLSWMVIIACFFVLYLVVEYKDKKLNEIVVKDINQLLLIYITLFLPMLIVSIFEKYDDTLVGHVYLLIVKVSLWPILALPFILMVLSMVNYKKPLKNYFTVLTKLL